jgi:hypothetical protein
MSDPVKSPDPLYDPIYGDAVVLITDLKAEIAALQTERDRLRAQLEERLYETAPRLANENKGLRAALEDIVGLSKEAGPNTNIWFAGGIALRALGK